MYNIMYTESMVVIEKYDRMLLIPMLYISVVMLTTIIVYYIKTISKNNISRAF